MRSDDRNGRSVLDRAFTLLDAFTSEDRTLSLAVLVERTRLPKATAFRLASQLVSLGVLERVTRGYRLGTRLFELGSRVAVHQSLRNVALPFMEDLFEASHETINLAVSDGHDLLYIDRINGHRVAPRAPRVGMRRPLYCTALGKAILAFSPDHVINEVLATGLHPHTPYTIVSAPLLRQQLVETRLTRIAYDREEYGAGVACVATPVIHQGRAIAALSIAGPTGRFDPARYGIAIRAVGLSLARAVSGAPYTTNPVP
jgi:DNA-binding IclR family transcriptional regulator